VDPSNRVLWFTIGIVLRRNSNHSERNGRRNMKRLDKRTEQLMKGTPLDTSSKAAENFANQVRRSCMMKCSRCGRLDYQMEAGTGLCLVCIGKEEEC
jgi:hypothetical protein